MSIQFGLVYLKIKILLINIIIIIIISILHVNILLTSPRNHTTNKIMTTCTLPDQQPIIDLIFNPNNWKCIGMTTSDYFTVWTVEQCDDHTLINVDKLVIRLLCRGAATVGGTGGYVPPL